MQVTNFTGVTKFTGWALCNLHNESKWWYDPLVDLELEQKRATGPVTQVGQEEEI